MFDMIETVNSLEIAREIDKRCATITKLMPVLIEINISLYICLSIIVRLKTIQVKNKVLLLLVTARHVL